MLSNKTNHTTSPASFMEGAYEKRLATSVFLPDADESRGLYRQILTMEQLPPAFCDGQPQYLVTCFNMLAFNTHMDALAEAGTEVNHKSLNGSSVERFIISGSQRLIVSHL